MNAAKLLADLKEHARIVGDDEDAGVVLMLATAAADVAHAAGIELPEDADELPEDLRFAIVDHASRLYDLRGADDAKPGLSLAASRIVARYRGVSLGAADEEAG